MLLQIPDLPPWWLAVQLSTPEPLDSVNQVPGQPGAAGVMAPSLATAPDWLGVWALRFTPRVVRLHEAWLLEVSTTLRLWGGWSGLLAQLQLPLADTHAPVWAVDPAGSPPHMRMAAGPTALAALARLRAGQVLPSRPQVSHGSAAHDNLLPSLASNRSELLQLPLHTLNAARSHAAVLARLGVQTWGQLCRLPREGVARRWGSALLRELDQALGLQPQAHSWLEPTPEFDMQLEWPHHLDTSEALMAPAQQLLSALLGWLCHRQLGVLALRWSWTHDHRRNVPLHGGFDLQTAQPGQNLEHLQRLTAEHLTRQSLLAPVVSLRLQTLAHAPFVPESTDWLRTHTQHQPTYQMLGWSELLERLSARLGDQAVCAVQPDNDHRPEHMQHSQPARIAGSKALSPLQLAISASGAGVASPLLPTWILRQPLPLSLRGNRPCYQGELQLLAGPQRLEATHWPTAGIDPDQASTQRDYFVARSPGAGLLWVFRLRPVARSLASHPPASWFLHGVFA